MDHSIPVQKGEAVMNTTSSKTVGAMSSTEVTTAFNAMFAASPAKPAVRVSSTRSPAKSGLRSNLSMSPFQGAAAFAVVIGFGAALMLGNSGPVHHGSSATPNVSVPSVRFSIRNHDSQLGDFKTVLPGHHVSRTVARHPALKPAIHIKIIPSRSGVLMTPAQTRVIPATGPATSIAPAASTATKNAPSSNAKPNPAPKSTPRSGTGTPPPVAYVPPLVAVPVPPVLPPVAIVPAPVAPPVVAPKPPVVVLPAPVPPAPITPVVVAPNPGSGTQSPGSVTDQGSNGGTGGSLTNANGAGSVSTNPPPVSD
jgi:hypothetical protein